VHVNTDAQDTLLQRRPVMEVVSFVSGEVVGGEGRGGRPAATRLLDAADDNGSVALGVVNKKHMEVSLGAVL